MRRLVLILLPLLLLVAACSNADEQPVGEGSSEATPSPDTTDTADTTDSADTTEAVDTTDAVNTTTEATTAPESSAVDEDENDEADLEPTSDESATGTNGDPEQAELCDAYLRYKSPATLEAGIDELVSILGVDAPPGVQDALDVLSGDVDDIEAFFEAVDTLEGYVRPICAERFAAGTVPSASASAAASEFFAALVDGDRVLGELVAAEDVVVQFDWTGYPEATFDFADFNHTFTMVLEPTVSVFCQVDDNIVEFCAFGE